VLKKGVFFPARANKLYEVYKFYDCIEDIDTKISQQIQRYYFGRSFNEVYQEIKEHYSRKNIKELDNIESSPKHKMAVIFKEYFRLSTKAALIGDATNKVNFQIMCGPSLGAFNQWAKKTELKDWRNRHIDEIGVRLIQEAEYIIKNRISYKF
jgi:trans-AT polyketide synthase/acyltransferase/oxidoreductase domain-containing protein